MERTISDFLLINSITIKELISFIVVFILIDVVKMLAIAFSVWESTQIRMKKHTMPLLYEGKLKICQDENVRLKAENKELLEINDRLNVRIKTMKEA